MREARLRFRPRLLQAALAAGTGALLHCAARAVDVVDVGTGGDAGVIASTDAGALTYVWPNDASFTNSDPWIAAHHDQIVEMDPHVLLLNFANAYDAAATQALVTEHINAFAEASKYHGYNDATAKPFIQYKLEKIVDLRDNSGNVDSAMLPVSNGNVDYAALNSAAFANLIGIQDPDAPGTNLNLCGLFEKGIIHEVWGMVADPVTTAKFAVSVETKEAYDPNDNPIVPREMVCASNGPCIDMTVPCKVSTRFYDFNPTRGTGCHLFANGVAWGVYIQSNALPAFTKAARTFFNLDFQERFNASFSSFYDVCQNSGATGVCIDWLSPTHAASGPASSKTFDFSPMTAGCGKRDVPAQRDHRIGPGGRHERSHVVRALWLARWSRWDRPNLDVHERVRPEPLFGQSQHLYRLWGCAADVPLGEHAGAGNDGHGDGRNPDEELVGLPVLLIRARAIRSRSCLRFARIRVPARAKTPHPRPRRPPGP